MSGTDKIKEDIKEEDRERIENPETTDQEPEPREIDRIRTLTDKGQEQYEEEKEKLRKRSESSWSSVQVIIEKLSNADVSEIDNLEANLKTNFERFCELSSEYTVFLKHTRTKESLYELTTFENIRRSCDSIYNSAMAQMKLIRSVDARTSKSSRSTCTSSSKRKARLAQKLKLAEEEAQIRKKKADIKHQREEEKLNADLNVLKIKQEVAEAETESSAAASVHDEVDSRLRDLPTDNEKTERYVAKHFQQPKDEQHSVLKNDNHDDYEPCENEMNKSFDMSNIYENTINIASGFTNYLFQKDSIKSRLTVFDNKPEHYPSWKANFKGIMKELNATHPQEIQYLINHLGDGPQGHVITVQSKTGSNPKWGLSQIWERLDERYGAPEMIEAAIKNRLNSFPKLTKSESDSKKLYDLVDIMIEIEMLMSQPTYNLLLSYFNSSSGVLPIICKLPYNLQEKWATRASAYKARHKVPHPPFSYVLDFMKEICRVRNDPAFSYMYQEQSKRPVRVNHGSIIARKTEVSSENTFTRDKVCPVHDKEHSLNDCREFQRWDLAKRKELLKKKGICFKCCESAKHLAKDCKQSKQCKKCNGYHPTALHIEQLGKTQTFKTPSKTENSSRDNGGEGTRDTIVGSKDNGGERTGDTIVSKCTTLCGEDFSGRSCSKTVLVKIFPANKPENAIKTYAILDEHSNRTLATSDLIDRLGIETEQSSYRLSSCAGVVNKIRRKASGCVVQSFDGKGQHNLPTLIECDEIPNELSEIPTPEVARAHKHLKAIEHEFQPLHRDAKIQLLIGRDLADAYHIHKQITGPEGSPFAQKLTLGWVIVGEVCIGEYHKGKVNVFKTNILPNGRNTIFQPCHSKINIKEQYNSDTLFMKTKDDEQPGLSQEDRKFLELMDKNFEKDDSGLWTAPLPFKEPRSKLEPNNRSQALQRARQLETSLKKNPTKLEHFTAFMDKVFQSGAAERAPDITDKENQEMWYLPIFGVYHPKKPQQIRGVFDSSVMFQGHSLNNALLSGPNLANSLLGVLLRFRKDKCALTADIEQMFYRFYVREDHRDFLRFFWFEENDPSKPMVEFRMKVHVFGNRPSPAVATYGLRKAAENAEDDVRQFINRDFYVDDALTSVPSCDEAVSLLKRSREHLKLEGRIRLHKIASNDKSVMSEFPKEELGKDLKDIELNDSHESTLPLQSSLGLSWNLNTDCFEFYTPTITDRPFTRRGLLSSVSSIFDPMGFLGPFTVSGRILLRETCPENIEWDEPLPEIHKDMWKTWNDNLELLNGYKIQRMFVPTSYSLASDRCIRIYSDASERAVAAAAYLESCADNGQRQIGFIMGKTKLAPPLGHSIPRLELCGAVLATEIGQIVAQQLDFPLTEIKYFTDSKVVLGYIRNESRRFYTYVSNRVAKIQQTTNSSQWNYVPTHLNPADAATRDSSKDIISAVDKWISGPQYLMTSDQNANNLNDYPLVNPEGDKEIRPIRVLKTTLSYNGKSLVEKSSNFSSWDQLIRAISILRHVAKTYNATTETCKPGWHICPKSKSVEILNDTRNFVLQNLQEIHYANEIDSLKQDLPIKKSSSLVTLSPYLDENGLLRIGGRLKHLQHKLGLGSTNPIIVPKGHIATLLIRHFHEKTFHQGRKLTEGLIRSNGYWIVGAKRLIVSFISKCVTCRKMRGSVQVQKMADLPEDRLTPGPPFASVGVDCFGPWNVLTRRTRGGAAQSKRWAVIFTCLTTRAVHIEVLEEMSSSSFINALRRTVAIRGHISVFRSDRGTNFVGCTEQIGIQAINVEDTKIVDYLHSTGSVWKFNPPHSSHMGGVWERMIGITRRILDGIFNQNKKPLTHEILSTFMAEAAAVINSRPITSISNDPESPCILSPNILLTQKQGDVSLVSGDFSLKHIYSSDWKHVQVLSNMFWKQWHKDYLSELQTRQKWYNKMPNLKPGDMVLVKEQSLHRNDWPIGIIETIIKSDDDLVRKVVVRISREGKLVTYTRPITELVLLLED